MTLQELQLALQLLHMVNLSPQGTLQFAIFHSHGRVRSEHALKVHLQFLAQLSRLSELPSPPTQAPPT